MGVLGARPGGGATPIVGVLGRFHLEVGLEPIVLPVQAQRVVGYLAVASAPARRDAVAGNLWPYSPQRRAAANLRTALWKIGAACPRLIDASRATVALAEDVTVDLHRATRQAQAIIRAAYGDPNVLAEPLLAWQGDLLPGWDEEWLVIERERVRQLRMHSLEALSRQLASAGRHAEAIDAALATIAAEPLRESAQLALIEAHLAEGNVREARLAFDRYRELLRTELGLEPSAKLWRLLAATEDADPQRRGTGAATTGSTMSPASTWASQPSGARSCGDAPPVVERGAEYVLPFGGAGV